MSPRRNLLVILPNGLRSDAVADEQVWPLQTPNLCQLAARGLRLVCTSACPADRGGMVSLLTGLHARQHGFFIDSDRACVTDGLPTWLSDAGYRVGAVGCLGSLAHQVCDSVIVESASELNLVNCAYWKFVRSKGLGPAIMQQRKARNRSGPFDPDRLLLEVDDDVDGFITNEAIKMIDRMPTDQPWALIVLLNGPGNDLPPPAMFESVLDPADLQQGFTPPDLTQIDALAEPSYPRIMLQRLDPYHIGRIRADYLGRVALIDQAVGRLVSQVNNRPDRDHTWTVFSSDRGHLLGEHGLIGRRSFLAGAVEVPLMIAPPAIGPSPSQRDDEGLFSTVDVAATIGALGAADIPPGVVGRSLMSIWRSEPVMPLPPGGLLSEFNDRLMLETERYKIVFNRARCRCIGLYDLLQDPDERQNLVETAVGRNVIDSLRWRVADALIPLRAPGIAV